jgi:hypothetical protein
MQAGNERDEVKPALAGLVSLELRLRDSDVRQCRNPVDRTSDGCGIGVDAALWFQYSWSRAAIPTTVPVSGGIAFRRTGGVLFRLVGVPRLRRP